MFNGLQRKPPRLTDADCTNFFQRNYGAPNVVHLKEYAHFVMHACKAAGIMQFNMQSINLMGRQVMFAQCPYCRKVWYFVPQVL